MKLQTKRDSPMQFLLFCSLVLVFTGCQNQNGLSTSTPAPNSSASPKLKVVATTGMVADMVRQIGGEQVELIQLMKSGIDPHLYKPNVDDVIAIKRAEVVFYNGFKLEGKMSDLLDLIKTIPRTPLRLMLHSWMPFRRKPPLATLSTRILKASPSTRMSGWM